MAWFSEFDDATRAYVTNKGWDKIEDGSALQTILKAYQNLEKVRPDPEKTIQLPVAGDAASEAAFYQRLGVPKSAAEYKFEGVEKADSDLIDYARNLAFQLHLTPAAATSMAQSMISWGEEGNKTAADALAERIKTGTESLKTAWGDGYDANLATASNAFEALKWPKETVDALVETLGIDNVMKMGHNLGSRMGEGSFLTGDGTVVTTPPKPTLSREQALVERNRLMDDTEFAKKVANGDVESLKKIHDLSLAIVGTPEKWSKPPENFGRTRDDPYGEQQVQPQGQQ